MAVVPPLLPAHDQLQGPVPATDELVPVLQRLVVGFDATVVPFDEPHMPFTGGGATVFWAEQLAFVPPLLPAQLHDHGPAPLMVEAVPILQRLVVGTEASVRLFDDPHRPLTGGGAVS